MHLVETSAMAKRERGEKIKKLVRIDGLGLVREICRAAGTGNKEPRTPGQKEGERMEKGGTVRRGRGTTGGCGWGGVNGIYKVKKN